MKTIKANVNQFEGLAITVEIKGSLKEYAMSFLHIVNNVRDNEELLKVKNHFNNDVTVYCTPEYKNKVIRYLESFGEIKSCENVLMYQLEDADGYDFDKYDEAVVVPDFD